MAKISYNARVGSANLNDYNRVKPENKKVEKDEETNKVRELEEEGEEEIVRLEEE